MNNQEVSAASIEHSLRNESCERSRCQTWGVAAGSPSGNGFSDTDGRDSETDTINPKMYQKGRYLVQVDAPAEEQAGDHVLDERWPRVVIQGERRLFVLRCQDDVTGGIPPVFPLTSAR
jgi:hypothetical protein